MLTRKIQHHLLTEQGRDAGQFEIEFFLNFLTKEFKGYLLQSIVVWCAS